MKKKEKKGHCPEEKAQLEAAGNVYNGIFQRVALDRYLKRKTLSELDENYNLDIQEANE